MSHRKILTAATTALVLLGWRLVAAPTAGQDSPATAPVATPATISLRNCQVYWEDQRIVSSKIQGRIAKRPVKDGQIVEEGEVLAVLDDREARLEFMRQDKLGKSELDELTQYKKEEEYHARFDSASRLVRKQAIPIEEWRLAKVNVDVNELLSKKEREKREIEQLKAEQAEVVLNEHVIRSPIRGIIKKCFKREMELVTPSDHQMFEIVAIDKVWVEGYVPVTDVYRVKLDQDVKVSLTMNEADKIPSSATDERKQPVSPGLAPVNSKASALPQIELPVENNFEGSLVFIDPSVNFSARVFLVRAEVENKVDPETKLPILRAGMNANMTITIKPPTAKNGEPKN